MPPMIAARKMLVLLLAVLPVLLRAETRVFVDNNGRTLRGELISVSGDMVTIKREDGQSFTMKSDGFCPADMAFFREFAAKPAPAAGPIVIESYIDGPSDLRVTKDGIYWINGRNAKPGRHDKHHDPTYVNGQEWQPQWTEPGKDRGKDQCSPYEIKIPNATKLEFKLLAVTKTREQEGIEKRDPVIVSKDGEELVINIRDSQGGARWYKFSLTPAP
jgi:hypothetical protein